MKRLAAAVALLATLLTAAPAAAYEAVVIDGTTNYLELTGATTKGQTTTQYTVDVGAFEDVPLGKAGRYYVCLRVRETRDGVFVGSNFGCTFEATQTRLTFDGSFAASLAETTITLDRSSSTCCMAGRTVTVAAIARPISSVAEFAGCFSSETGDLTYSINNASMSGLLSVKGKVHAASGDGSRYAFTPACADGG